MDQSELLRRDGRAHCRDPEDDKFIRCAIAGRCRYLFSGDEDLLSLGKVGMIRIVPPEKFLRTGFEELQFAQPGLLREALHVASQISAKTVVAAGHSGKAVGEHLRLRRIEAIRQALKLTMDETNG